MNNSIEGKRISNTLIIIPARYASTRFPGKCLKKIDGKELLLRTYEQCLKCKEYHNNIDIFVALDNDKVKNLCLKNNINYIITDYKNITGTDRVNEAYNYLINQTNNYYKNIVNVQGDEPFVNPEDILKIIYEFEEKDLDVACGMIKIKTQEEFENRNIIKVLFQKQLMGGYTNYYFNKFIYASRSPIPYNKDGEFIEAFKQVCIYCFTKDSLNIFNNQKSKIEEIEDIELLRLLDYPDFSFGLVELENDSMSVDVPEDIQKAEEFILNKKFEVLKKEIRKGDNIIAIDFDGVIHKNSKGFHDGTIYDDPIDGAEEGLKYLKSLGFDLVIFTCKANNIRPLVNGKTGTELIWEWLEKHNLKQYISDITYTKPWALLYIDDKSYRFNSWNEFINVV